jgi:nucleolin
MSTTLFVGDLSICCTVDVIEKEFEKYGEIVDIRIKTDPITRKSLSYGFVEYSTPEAAQNAFNCMDKFVLQGRAIR